MLFRSDRTGSGAIITNTAVYNEPAVTASSLNLNGSGSGNTSRVGLTFDAEAGSGLSDQVSNVTFRIDDVDQGTHRDFITIRAWDINGNMVVIILSQPATGNDTVVNGTTTTGATITAGNGATNPSQAPGSVLVTIPGPVHYIEIDYNNNATGGQDI